MTETDALVPHETIERKILVIRGQKVILDEDLASLFGVATKRLKEQVRRNRDRFPADFLFELTSQEVSNLRSQFATSSWGGSRYRPFAFTEHGAIMAASVLNSPRAIEASVWVVRAFVKFREALATHRLLLKKLSELEAKVGVHDQELKLIFRALKSLMAKPPKKRRAIGFGAKEARGKYRT